MCTCIFILCVKFHVDIIPLIYTVFLFQSFASPVALKEVEDKIRKAVHARNVRLTEYFKDFDRLRTGFITSKLFKSLSK